MEERVLYLNEGVCLLLFRKFIFERDMIVHFKKFIGYKGKQLVIHLVLVI